MTVAANKLPNKKVGRDLTQGPVLKSLFVFVLPVILANLLQQVYSMVDLMIIGQFVGNIGTVGVSTGGEISDFLTPVATAFAIAGQVYIAQLAGAKREKELKEGIGTFLTMMMLASLVFMAAIILFRNPILHALNCPEEAYEQAEAYMVITAIGMPFIFGYNAVAGVLRGMGNSSKPMIFVSIAAVVNIFLDLLLVVVIPMEAAGTAIATAASQLASFLAALVFMLRHKEQFDFEIKLRYFKISPAAAKVILEQGLPQAIRSILVRFSIVWVNASVNSYGLIASSTNSVGNKLQKFLEIFSTSMSQASGAMIGQNLGANKHDRAKKVVYCALSASTVISLIIIAIVLIFPHALYGIFTKDPEVIDMGVVYLNIMIVHFLSSAVVSSYQAMVIGSGNASLNFLIGILDGVVCKIGLCLLLAQGIGMGINGYFWGTSLSRVLPALLCVAFFYSGKWKKNRILK